MDSARTLTCAKHLAPSLQTITSLCEQILDTSLPSTNRISACNALCRLLDEYLPEPALLDSVLGDLVKLLIPSINMGVLEMLANPSTSSDTDVKRVHQLPFQVLQVAHKVRGTKLVVRHYPHDVNSFSLCARLTLFAATHLTAPAFWRVRATLFYWLANVALMPFALRSLAADDVIDALANAALDALSSASPSAYAAALFLARFVTRKDASHLLNLAIDKCSATALDAKANTPARHGAMRALCAIFKFGRRDVLVPHATVAMQVATHTADLPQVSTIDAQLATKLAQRVALVHLPPRTCTWRYSRGQRILFGTTVPHLSEDNGTENEEPVVSISVEAQEDVERALAVVLGALENRDTVVRWSGAKGVGRVTARLDAELGGDVISHVLGTFDAAGDPGAWNGACLAVAELVRRGLILPGSAMFRRTLSAMERAAAFDVRRGAHSVGEHVRDAACYVVWALARAYDAADVREYAQRITRAMIRVALFDRELHCRRAAAAALQECVGRMPAEVIAEGIFLVSVADFFALTDRVNAFVDIAAAIGRVADGEYFDCIVEELKSAKLTHWDAAIRSLAAKALLRQVANDRNGVIVKKIIPQLIDVALKKGDVLHRHGAIVGLAEVLKVHGKSVGDADLLRLSQVQSVLHRDKCYNGRSADILQIAVCELTEALAKSVPHVYSVNGDEAVIVLNFLGTCLSSGQREIRDAGVGAYSAMCRSVFANDRQWAEKLSHSVSEGIRNASMVQRKRGFALAAGCFVGDMFVDVVFKSLIHAALDDRDVEVRRNAVHSLGRLSSELSSERAEKLGETLVESMADYAIDDRGDVGSWVREASMEATVVMFQYANIHQLPEQLVLRLLECIVRQSLERIDRTRMKAGKALYRISKTFSSEAKKIQESLAARTIANVSSAFSLGELPSEESEVMQSLQDIFSETETIFLNGTKLMHDSNVYHGALQGLVASAGGMGHQSGRAMSALMSFARSTSSESSLETLALDVSSLFVGGDERLVAAAFNVEERLARDGFLGHTSDEACVQIAMRTRKSWSGKLTDVKRTASAVSLLGELACVKCCKVQDSTARKCIEALVVVLAGVVPRLRRIAAEWLYLVLVEIQHVDFSEKAITRAMDLLCDTPWEQLKTAQVRQVRNKLCELLHVDKPVPKKIVRNAGL